MSVDQKTLNHQLIKAAQAGDAQRIEDLLWTADARAQQSEALWQAIDHNHKTCVKLLARVSDIEHRHLFAAVDCNDWDFLFPLVDYIDTNKHPNALNQCLVRAARFGHHKILGSLIEVANPRYQDSLAFRWAVVGDHQRCIDLLYPLSDVHHVLEYFKKDIDRSNGSFYSIEEPYKRLKERFNADQFKQTLMDNITPSTLNSIRKI